MFYRYHQGAIAAAVEADPSLMTDVQNGHFPSEQSWDALSGSSSWNTPSHNQRAFGITMVREKISPDDGGAPPMASAKLFASINGTTSGPTQTSSTSMEALMEQAVKTQMMMQNQMLQRENERLRSLPQGRADQLPADADLNAVKKRKLNDQLTEACRARKALLDCGIVVTSNVIVSKDSLIARVSAMIDELELQELDS